MNGISGVNTRTIGVSRDQELAAIKHIGGGFALIHNDPELAAQAAAWGVQVIYRQSGDDNLNTDPAAFVQERAKNAPTAAYLHLTNEIDPSNDLNRWTKEALDYADSIKRKCCIYNLSTHKNIGQWQTCLGNISRVVQGSHAIGWHAYCDNTHNTTAFEFLPLKRQLGGLWLATEFAYARSYTDAHKGWRGVTSPEQRAAFIRQWAAWLAAEQMPACWFCYDPWDQPNVDAAKAEGFGYWNLPDVLASFHETNTIYTFKGVPPMTQPFPVPTTGGVRGAIASMPADKLNLRARPDTSAADLGDIFVHDTGVGYPDVLQSGWMYFQADKGVTGWIFMYAGRVQFVPELLPAPVTDVVYTEAEHAALVADYVALSKRIKGAPVSGGGF